MKSIEQFDNYILGLLNPEDLIIFENRLKTDPLYSAAFNEYKIITHTLNQLANRTLLKKELEKIHINEFGINSNIISINRKKRFIKEYLNPFAIALCASIIGVFGTLVFLNYNGGFSKKQNNQITELNREASEPKRIKQNDLKESSQSIVKNAYSPANIEGSAFAMNNNGYIITSYHTIVGADSIFIQNNLIERTLTTLILSDPKLDLAILKIENSSLYKNWKLPFNFKSKGIDIGEKVFTLGYPRQEIVYGEGSLSSLTGYLNDTCMYQISIPVNPGNSGGPLLDENGTIIGVIRGKINSAEGTGFAIKTDNILKSIQLSSPDSLKSKLLTKNHSFAFSLKNLKRSEQIKLIQPYVFNVLVYK